MKIDHQFAVIFDMDGVLVENTKAHLQAWKLTFKKYGKNEKFENIVKFFGGASEVFIKHFLGKTEDEEIKAIASEKELLYQQIFKKEIKAPSGLINLLEDLKQNKIKTAVATSAPTENLNFVLDHLNLRSYFNVLVDANYVKKTKPDPEIYLMTSEKLGINPQNCMVIEDAVYGIEAALAAGMKVIAITTTFEADKLHKANSIIKSFKEINVESIRKIIYN